MERVPEHVAELLEVVLPEAVAEVVAAPACLKVAAEGVAAYPNFFRTARRSFQITTAGEHVRQK